jgi:hypothetical protein
LKIPVKIPVQFCTIRGCGNQCMQRTAAVIGGKISLNAAFAMLQQACVADGRHNRHKRHELQIK